MNLAFRVVLSALLGAWCVTTSFAQVSEGSCGPNLPETRAEVRADLLAWLAAGYDRWDWKHYPDSAIRTGRIVAEQRGQAVQMCPR
jgi:hypothetical protein